MVMLDIMQVTRDRESLGLVFLRSSNKINTDLSEDECLAWLCLMN